MTTIQRMQGLLEELTEYVNDRHDVDCTGDPPRFISNAWGEPLRMIGGLEALLRQIAREAGAVEAGGGDVAGERGAPDSDGRESAPLPDEDDDFIPQIPWSRG